MDREGKNYDKAEIPDSRRSMHGYILNYSRFEGRTCTSSEFSTEGTLSFVSAVPHCGTIDFVLVVCSKMCGEWCLSK